MDPNNSPYITHDSGLHALFHSLNLSKPDVSEGDRALGAASSDKHQQVNLSGSLHS